MMRRRGPGLIGTAARTAVFAGTATAVSGRVQRRQNERWSREDAEKEAAYYAQQQQQQPPPSYGPPPGEPDYTAELEQLARLRQQGILSEEEFQAKKKQILGI